MVGALVASKELCWAVSMVAGKVDNVAGRWEVTMVEKKEILWELCWAAEMAGLRAAWKECTVVVW